MSFGISFTGVTFFQAAPVVPVQGANNGTSLSGTDVQLGNAVGDAAQPAQLLNNREIPMLGNSITFNEGVTGNVRVSGTQVVASSLNNINFRAIHITGGIVCDFAAFDIGAGLFTQSLARGIFVFSTSLPLAGNVRLGLFPVASTDDNGALLQVVGNMTVGGTIATGSAKVHIAAGAAGAGTAPIKYTAGVANQTVLENGAKNFNGTNEFLTAGGVNYTMAKTLTATAALNFGNTAAQTSADLTIALTGAADADVVMLGVPVAALNADSCYTAFVSAVNTVTVRFNNYSAGAIDPASGTFRVSIVKY